jgi:DHA3 family macrolide efflux protein-like MFS transporter
MSEKESASTEPAAASSAEAPAEPLASESMPGWARRVTLFLTAQTISMFGSFLVQYAIFWHLTLTTKSGLVLALAAIFGFLPQAIVSIFAGVWADRVNRKIMIIAADASIAVATLGLAFLMLSGVSDLWLIFLVMAVRSVGAGIQMPAVNAMIPQIVPSDKLMRVNGISSSIQSAMGLLAPIAAAAVYANMSIVPIFFIDVVTAVIGVSIFAFIAVPTLERVNAADKPSYFADLKDGMTYIFTHDLVRWVMGIFAVVFLLAVAPSNLSPLLIARNFGSEVWKLTVAEILFSVGMALGGIALATLASKVNKISLIITTSICFGFLSIAMGFAPNLWIFYALFFVIGLIVPSFFTSAMTTLQETVEPERQGRVFGFVGIVISVAMPVGMSVLGPLADVFPVENLLVASGITMIIAVGLAVWLPAGRRAVKAARASSEAKSQTPEAQPAD